VLVQHHDSSGFDRWTGIWLGCAAVWSLLLILAGFVVKAYSGTSTGGVAVPSTTLVHQNGLKVVFILLIPLVGVTIVAATLWYRHRAHKRCVGILGWIVVTLIGFLVLLGAFTVGPFIAPVAIFLLVAALRTQGNSPSRQDATTDPINGPTQFDGVPL
jgi:hypothetical protein